MKPILPALRQMVRKALDKTAFEKSVPIAHGYSLELVNTDGLFSVELGMQLESHWLCSNHEGPIKVFVGGIGVALGELVVTDQNRDLLFQAGRNLLGDFVYG